MDKRWKESKKINVYWEKVEYNLDNYYSKYYKESHYERVLYS